MKFVKSPDELAEEEKEFILSLNHKHPEEKFLNEINFDKDPDIVYDDDIANHIPFFWKVKLMKL